jgi:hypothetical protein
MLAVVTTDEEAISTAIDGVRDALLEAGETIIGVDGVSDFEI